MSCCITVLYVNKCVWKISTLPISLFSAILALIFVLKQYFQKISSLYYRSCKHACQFAQKTIVDPRSETGATVTTSSGFPSVLDYAIPLYRKTRDCSTTDIWTFSYNRCFSRTSGWEWDPEWDITSSLKATWPYYGLVIFNIWTDIVLPFFWTFLRQLLFYSVKSSKELMFVVDVIDTEFK